MSGLVSPIQALVRPDIRNAVVEVWSQSLERQTFVADEICKRIDMPFSSGTLIRIPREAFTKDTATVDRAADGRYQEIEYKTDTLQYATKEQALAMRVDQKISNQAKTYFDAEVYAGRILLSRLFRAHEKTVAAAVMNTTTFTGSTLTAATSNNWRTDQSGATPVQDILNARKNVRQNCGRDANTLIMDWVVWQNLRESAQILARVTGGARPDIPGSVTEQDVAKVLEIPNIIVAKGIADTTNMGQTFVGSGIWSQTACMVAYINPAASAFDITPFMAMHWDGDGGAWEFTMESFFSNERRGEVVRARRDVGVFTPYPECGFLVTNCA